MGELAVILGVVVVLLSKQLVGSYDAENPTNWGLNCIRYYEYEPDGPYCVDRNDRGSCTRWEYRELPSSPSELTNAKDVYTSHKHNEGFMAVKEDNPIDEEALKVVPQEGRSFCIVPEHINAISASTGWKDSPLLKAMEPLITANMDIGTHIDHEDYSKMKAKTNFKIDENSKVSLLCEKESEKTWKYRPAEVSRQPDPGCTNPYKVKVTEIYANGLRLQNWLHIKVYADEIPKKKGVTLTNCPTGKIRYLILEVRDQGGMPVGQFTDDVVPCDRKDPKADKDRKCPAGLTCKKYSGTKDNTMPCMFTPLRAVTHPYIFMMSAKEEEDASSPLPADPGVVPPPAPPAPPPAPPGGPPGGNPPVVPVNNNTNASYVTEVHTTWKFAQHTSSLVTQLHFSALIVEDDTPIDYYSGRRNQFGPEWRCSAPPSSDGRWGGCWGRYENCRDKSTTRETYRSSCTIEKDALEAGNRCLYWTRNKELTSYTDSNDYKKIIPDNETNIYAPNVDWYACYLAGNETLRMYGYTAQYTVLKPTLKTLGAPDYFRKNYIKASQVDCDVEIDERSEFYQTQAELKGVLLKSAFMVEENWKKNKVAYTISDIGTGNKRYVLSKKDEIPAYTIIIAHAVKDPNPFLKTPYELDDPATSYFGTKYTKTGYDPKYEDLSNKKMAEEFRLHTTLQTQAVKERCPCPKLPTTVPPELATRPPNELDGRRLHAVQMLIAWVVLVPVSIFSSRYYKETFSKVHFLQEFWWYTIHVLCLFTAKIFMLGGIYALEIKKSEGGVWVEATYFHVIIGSITMVLFGIHLCLGFLRAINVELRLIQITLHWLTGWVEYLLASTAILSSASIPQGFMSCEAIFVYYGFLGFQLIFYIGMEIHMRYVDKLLHLNPKRSYLPPPVMRIFHKNAPYSVFRMYMLLLYTVVCLSVFGAMHTMMTIDGNEGSCYQKVKEHEVVIGI